MIETEKNILQLFSYVNEIENIEQRRRFIGDLQEILSNLKIEPANRKEEIKPNVRFNDFNFQKSNNSKIPSQVIPFWFLSSLNSSSAKNKNFDNQEISNREDIESLIEEIANTIFNSNKNTH